MSRVSIDNRSLTRRSRNQRGSFVFTAESRRRGDKRGVLCHGGAVVEEAGKLGNNAPEDGGMAALKGRSTERGWAEKASELRSD
jgi:hypothetical protein